MKNRFFFFLMKYYIKKIIYAFKNKTLLKKSFFYFRNILYIPFFIISNISIKRNKSTPLKIKIIKTKGSNNDIYIIRKIISSYLESKKIVLDVNSPFQIKGLWKEWIEINFKDLIKNLNNKNESLVSKQLNNMFQESFTRGLSIYDGYLRLKRPFGNLYYKSVWEKYYKLYLNANYDLILLNFQILGILLG